LARPLAFVLTSIERFFQEDFRSPQGSSAADILRESSAGTPELVIQEFYGYLLAHFTIRSLMHQAALKTCCDPDSLSFTGAVRVVCRKIIAAHFPPPACAD